MQVIEDDLEQELVCLPNGWEVHASSPSEAHFLYREIFQDHCYLQHGITVQEGDVVVDVGANIGAFLQALLMLTSMSAKVAYFPLKLPSHSLVVLHLGRAVFLVPSVQGEGRTTSTHLGLGASSAKHLPPQ